MRAGQAVLRYSRPHCGGCGSAGRPVTAAGRRAAQLAVAGAEAEADLQLSCFAIDLPTSPSSRVLRASFPLLLSLSSEVAMSFRPSANFAWSLVSSLSTFVFSEAYDVEMSPSSLTAFCCFLAPSSTLGAPALE